jgi:hypothetical protein
MRLSRPPRALTNTARTRGSRARSVGHARATAAGALGGAAERHRALLVALADHRHGAAGEIEMGRLDAQELGDAQAARIRQLEQRPVAQRQPLLAFRLRQQALDSSTGSACGSLRSRRGGGSCASGSVASPL